MASKALKSKNIKRKYLITKGKMSAVKHRNRCELCGRSRGYIRMYKMCRICFRERALAGDIPGVKKATW